MIFLPFVKKFDGFKLFFLDKHVFRTSNELFDLTWRNILVTYYIHLFFLARQSFGKFIHAEKFDKL